MQLKNGVDISRLSPAMQVANAKAAVIWHLNGQELVVTAGRDGVHMNGSKHYTGDACDYRTRYFPEDIIYVVLSDLRTALGPDYDVVLHDTHIHCEYDPE